METGKKEQNNAVFHQKFLLFPYLNVSSSEPLERWATMWPHSEHLVTIWNTPAVNWRRWRREKRSLVLFMILGLVAIWVPPFMSTPRYGPHMRRGLSAALESYLPSPLHPFPPHLEVLKKRSSPSPSFMALRDILYCLRCLSVWLTVLRVEN